LAQDSPHPDPPRHSRLGIASVVLGALTWLAGAVLVVLSFLPETGTYASRHADNRLFVFGLLIAPALHLAGLGIGIAGAIKKSSRRALAVTGIVLNGVPLALAIFGWILVVILGVAVLTSGGGWR
jgi:hypothetical protein